MLSFALALLLTAPTKPVSLDVKDADIQNVLRLLADVGKVNIVVSDNVKGRVTLKLKHVPWEQALAIVLASRGLGQERTGGVIEVDTIEALTKRAEVAAKRRASEAEVQPLVTVIIPVSNARAEELLPLVQARLTARGSVRVDKRTNTLIVTDVNSVVSSL